MTSCTPYFTLYTNRSRPVLECGPTLLTSRISPKPTYLLLRSVELKTSQKTITNSRTDANIRTTNENRLARPALEETDGAAAKGVEMPTPARPVVRARLLPSHVNSRRPSTKSANPRETLAYRLEMIAMHYEHKHEHLVQIRTDKHARHSLCVQTSRISRQKKNLKLRYIYIVASLPFKNIIPLIYNSQQKTEQSAGYVLV
jgi:hypothetical protein